MTAFLGNKTITQFLSCREENTLWVTRRLFLLLFYNGARSLYLYRICIYLFAT